MASPLGFSDATDKYYKSVLLPGLEELNLTVIDPWTIDAEAERLAQHAQILFGEEKRRVLRKLNHYLGERNARSLDHADGILAILDGADIDSGTASEVGFASALNKPIIGLRLDTRQSGDNEAAIVNLQVEYFIASTGGEIFLTLDAALGALGVLLANLPKPCI